MKKNFNITGMTCTACSSIIEKTLNKQDGIVSVQVQLLNNKMTVDFDDSIIQTNSIIEIIENLGYGASTNDENTQAIETKQNNEVEKHYNIMKIKCIFSFLFTIPLFYLAMGHMMNWPLPQFFLGNENTMNFALTQFLLTIAILFINQNYFINGFTHLFKLHPNMDSLIALGSAAATLYSIYGLYKIGYGLSVLDFELVHHFKMNLYFETAGMILTLITLGKTLETRAKHKTSDAISKLMDFAAKTALVLRDGQEIQIPIDEVKVDEICIVKPGSKIPVDGIIIDGYASIDESMISGESIPVDKSINDKVIGATINKSGSLKIRATNIGKDTTLFKIIQLVEEASSTKAPISKLADQVSSVFVPIVIVISAITFLVWLLIGSTLESALSSAIAVLVISCPCALGLATPTAIMVATGKGAQLGILIKSAEALEVAHHIDTIILDKTGTITQGNPHVINSFSIDDLFLPVAYALEKQSEHPLSKAVTKYCDNKQIKILDIEKFKIVDGQGIQAVFNGKTILGGNEKMMKSHQIDLSKVDKLFNEYLNEAKTVLFFAFDNQLLGLFAIADEVKQSSIEAIKQMQTFGYEVAMVTGDHQLVAENIAKQVNIKTIHSQVHPHEKSQIVADYQRIGKKVAMIGDGINDAPALALADVGLAIGSGTDVAIEAADFILIKNDLNDALSAILLSKATIKNIKQNLFWALIYNTIGIPLAAGVFLPIFGWTLDPMFGALAMSLSSVSVVSNALRLKNFKPQINQKSKGEKTMTKTLIINDMMCKHCVSHVENALSPIAGISKVLVDLESKTATVQCIETVTNDQLINALSEIGYKVNEIR